MQKACNAFSSKSHVCNTTEVAHSAHDKDINYNLNSDSEAWILVDIQSSDDNSAISQFGLVSISVNANKKRTFDCYGWSTNGTGEENQGATLTTDGRFANTTQCNAEKPVACCK